jgi:hypothetical protein
MRAPKTTVFVVAVAIAVAVSLPFIRDLYRISAVAKQYRLENAVEKEIETDALHKRKLSIDDFLDPKFMAKYGLNSKQYLDAQGYFSPSGNDWAKWSLETRTAAILMWKGDSRISAWRIYRTIRDFDDYYRVNDRSVPVVQVVSASLAQ